ncbi:MAG TPA: hypothetical protein PKA63_13160 [Oligoflexia bacterium]|nr:hypothetical protein [Oligoflexia bacterium]HMP49609.1 hypothetical protein [Oligoflexia bacterium]
MRYDDGEVLQGLDENWSFMGANAMEWGSALAVFMLISLFADSVARAMPFMLLGGIMTAVTLASMRKSFPDQERGVRNAVCTFFHFPPPGIPAPSKLQPIWSSSPLREIPKGSKFEQLGLGQMFKTFERQYSEAPEKRSVS